MKRRNIMTKAMLAVSMAAMVLVGGCSPSRGADTTDESGIIIQKPDWEQNTNANSSDAAATQPGNAEGTEAEKREYYRKTYTLRTGLIEECMEALLEGDLEKILRETYETTEPEVKTYEDTGITSRTVTVSINGARYHWSEANGSFFFSDTSDRERISMIDARAIANEFVDRLGWEVDETVRLCERGNTVEVAYRLCHDGVKYMGENVLFFEPGNEDEVGISGAHIRVTVAKGGICSVILDAAPVEGEILETYDPERDFVPEDEVESIIQQFYELREISLEMMDLKPEEMEMDMELIYMPYRDLAAGDIRVLIPAYEVRIPCGPASNLEVKIQYVDALTGIILDDNNEFY